MLRDTTLTDYGHRVSRALAYMAGNLERDLTLDELAEVACFSPCHFHRIYRAVAGETAAETVRRLRLSRASAALIKSTIPIERIARQAGYCSVAAFTRAFAAVFGITPAAYRRRRRLVVPANRYDDGVTAMYEIAFDTTPDIRVASIAHRGDYMGIGGAFDRLQAWAKAHGLDPATARSFGIFHNDPASVPAADLRSEACMEVGPDVAGDATVSIRTLPGGEHAVVIHQGPYAELEQAYRWLYGSWLPASGREAADRPCVEEYLNDCRTLPPQEWRTAVRLPLVPVAH